MNITNEKSIEAPPEVAHKFTDSKGDEWAVALNVSTIKAVRQHLSIDLLDLDNGKLILNLTSDPIMLVDVIYVVCMDEAEERGVIDSEFGARMAGDVIADATEAMLGALVSFIPNPRDRANMAKVLNKTHQIMEATRDLVDKEIANGALDKIAEKAIGDLSTNSPG